MGHHLNPSDEADLSSLVQWQSVDPVSRFLQRPKSSTPLETRQRITHLVSTLSALVVSLFLVTAIVALYFISNPTARLGTLCAFIVVFAANLAIFTSCRRYEVFVATAAYAAVLVVFVSGDFSAASNNIINNLYGANGTPDLMGSGGVGTAVVAPQTVTQIVYATDVKTATPVVTQVVETVQVTIVETATATSTSAAAKKKGWFNRFSTQIKVGVALGIAVAAAVGLCIGGYGLFLLSASVAASGLWVVRAGKKWIGRSKTGSAE